MKTASVKEEKNVAKEMKNLRYVRSLTKIVKVTIFSKSFRRNVLNALLRKPVVVIVAAVAVLTSSCRCPKRSVFRWKQFSFNAVNEMAIFWLDEKVISSNI